MVKIIREGLEDDLKEFDALFDLRSKKEIKTMPKKYIKGATLLSTEEAENLPTGKRVREHNGELWWYWLRSSGRDGFSACGVSDIGDVYDWQDVDCDYVGVRPALILNLTPEILRRGEFEIGGFFEFGGYEFEIISENLALCKEIIGRCAFRKDCMAEDANVYEKSDVKKYVDNWFNKAYREYKG